MPCPPPPRRPAGRISLGRHFRRPDRRLGTLDGPDRGAAGHLVWRRSSRRLGNGHLRGIGPPGVPVFRDGQRIAGPAGAAPGDYVWVPPHVPHREENPSPDTEAVVVIARSTQEAIVVNVPSLSHWNPAVYAAPALDRGPPALAQAALVRGPAGPGRVAPRRRDRVPEQAEAAPGALPVRELAALLGRGHASMPLASRPASRSASWLAPTRAARPTARRRTRARPGCRRC